ncbi:SAM-dependent methyltransferase [Chitinophaga silvatica]|uniref:S-adenosyl-L-methionine-dependent methyltransferase n=1 Tax=Chitinophaga silvatica TaxID=2282649 RepID=A0A3E1Y2I4_9BACT|nr:SAM-dependent methyltransferase [Chitinophaga silvatica]RFS18895.1 SAM-dependent methyltransferase [Chitinophaga silvatica]
MKDDVSSRTAQYMALFRALETTRPKSSRLFTDHFAHNFLDNQLKLHVYLSKFIPGYRSMVEKIIRKRIPGALSSGIARTRYIDDLLEKAILEGNQQVFILGAGFDTRCLRLPFLKNIKVIEIDHPLTAAYKLERLSKRHIPEKVFYHQIDFNKQSLDQLSVINNFNFSLPTTIIWEGVTNYLTQEAIDNTFEFLKRFAPGSTVLFTYVNQQLLDDPSSYFGGTKLLEDVSNIEEKWLTGFYPSQLASYLKKYHFELMDDQGAETYRQHYLPDRTEAGYEFYRVASVRRISE